MANWSVFRRDNGKLAMIYVDLWTGRVTECGEVERSCPIELVIEWIVSKGKPAPGDWISIRETGQLLVFSKERGVA